jgi:pimeloyl-ACP methyl ester carboxylesterase
VALPEIMGIMAKAIPPSRFVMIPRAAHLSNLERPSEFNRIVLEFLRENV